MARKLRIGVAGLGRGFTLMLPTLVRDARVELVAAADPRAPARELFAKEFGARAYPSVEELCADAAVEVVYVATPHELHAQHARIAAAHGKHVLVEKPMALTLDGAQAMIDAAHQAGVVLMVGHSHSFDAPIGRARELIASGAFGAVRMITALNFTDFLYRPRRPEELVTETGGGVVFSQAAHQVDIVRLLGGGRLHSVRAQTGAWDALRATEGAYSALLAFEDGAFASLTYSGYAHFDSDELCGWIGETGVKKDPARQGGARALLQESRSPEDETAMKMAGSYGGDASPEITRAGDTKITRQHEHFGLLLVSCERADLRPLPTGVMIYDDSSAWLDALPLADAPRAAVIDELYDAVVHGSPPLHCGAWGLATLEACLAILRSAREQRDILLERQIGISDGSARKA
jgi:phthalate 4,5-cis-dihydrodiol dehydrogenase